MFRVRAHSWLEWKEASRRVRKGLGVGLRAEPRMPPSSCQTSMTNPDPPGLPSLPLALRLPSLASMRPLLPPDISPPLLPLSLPKKTAAGLGAAAAGGAAAGRAAEGPGAAGPAAGGSLPGGLRTQREPGPGGHPAQVGGAEVGSRGWGERGRWGWCADVRCRRKDEGEA